ncbi:MAG: pyridoxamine 5'-phosphate oxidase family protein [Nitrospinota bacterium]|nr:pyridoxamine 5'-phosphate oxidase family protein [Nitrospinota bacterium]
MRFRDIEFFLKENHRGVITTKQKNGSLHSSIIVCGAFGGKAAFVAVRGKSIKVRNLRRDRNCSLLVVTNDWREWINIEGVAQLFDNHNSDPEDARKLLRDLYNVCGDSEHPNWEEYDKAMVRQDAVAILIDPEKIYGQIR